MVGGLGNSCVDDPFWPWGQGTQNHFCLVGLSTYGITHPQPLLKLLHPLLLALQLPIKLRFRHVTLLQHVGVSILHHRHSLRVVSGRSHGLGCTSTCTWCSLHWRNCTRVRRMRGVVRRFPGGSENIFREGIHVPQGGGVLPCIGPQGHRLRGVLFALRRRPPLWDSRFLLVLAVPLQEIGSW